MNHPDRRSRKRLQTSDHVTQVAVELFERHGYDAVTMEQIAAAADVARGTLYNHFPVKEAVLSHWMHAQLDQALEPLMSEPPSRSTVRSRLIALFEASARWWEAHRQYAAPYIRYRFQEVRDGPRARPSSEMISVYDRLIVEAQATKELRADTPAPRLAHYLHYLYLCALMTWLDDRDTSLEDELMHALEFFLAGATLGKRAGARSRSPERRVLRRRARNSRA